jgi:hypothetical protein
MHPAMPVHDTTRMFVIWHQVERLCVQASDLWTQTNIDIPYQGPACGKFKPGHVFGYQSSSAEDKPYYNDGYSEENGTLWVCIQELLFWNLGSDTGYPDGFRGFSHSVQIK